MDSGKWKVPARMRSDGESGKMKVESSSKEHALRRSGMLSISHSILNAAIQVALPSFNAALRAALSILSAALRAA